MKRLEENKKVNLLLEYWFMKNKKDKKNHKGVGEVKVEISMVLKEDTNPKNLSNSIITTRLGT